MESGAVIIGAGGHGRGVLETLRLAHAERPVLGFVDDNPHLQGQRPGGCPVLGDLGWLAANARHVHWLYMGLGHPRDRRNAAHRLADLDLPAPPLIHPSAVIHGDARLESGVFVGAGAIIAHATRVGRFALINLNATVGHDVVLGAYVSVGPGANIGGGVQVGEGAFVGMNATIPPGLRLGSWCEVAAASLVLRPVRPGWRVLGNPARELGPTEPTEEISREAGTGSDP